MLPECLDDAFNGGRVAGDGLERHLQGHVGFIPNPVDFELRVVRAALGLHLAAPDRRLQTKTHSHIRGHSSKSKHAHAHERELKEGAYEET